MPVLFESSDKKRPTSDAQNAKKSVKFHVGKEEKHHWGAFIQNPRHVHFATQAKDEYVILFLRRHFITQIPWILSALIIIVMPFFLIPLVENLIGISIPLNYQIIILGFWYTMTFAFIYVNFILWYYNVNLVTNERVVDIDFVYLLVQDVSATRIAQIEDVTYRRVGVLATLFDYGDVYVQTAGTEANIEFLSIPQPKRVAQILIDLLGQVT
ncbi:PH domain-containing protein [Candidatus Roizmanbacteria bacterium]|nr:PH domain-containing protein [Candidatus Roizmanbacteria bacterium]